jgi:hypothetical protein
MPAPDFVAAAEWPVTILALVIAVAVMVLTLREMPQADVSMLWKRPAQALPGLIAVLAFVAFPFYLTALVTLPMLGSQVGGETAFDYVVKYDNPRLRGKRMNCHPAVALSGMPLLYNRACHLPEAAKNAVDPGDIIRLQGTGNSLGVHYSTATAHGG